MIRAWIAAITLAAACGCGVSALETQVATYAAAEQACVAQADSYDAGVACVNSVKLAFCGPNGVWADAGVCPDGGTK